MRAELRLADRDAARQAHCRAAQWYREQGDVPSAIDHALRAEDYDCAVTLLTAHREALYTQGHRRDIARWLAAIPDRFLTEDPERALEHTSSLLLIGRPEAWQWLSTLWPCLPDDPRVRARGDLLAAIVHAGIGDAEHFQRHRDRARSRLAHHRLDDPFFERADSWEAALRSAYGQHDDAIAAAHQFLARTRLVVDDSVATASLAAVLLAAGDTERAGAVAELALDLWAGQGEPATIGMANALRVRAHLARRHGDLDGAGDALTRAEALVDGQVPTLVRAPVALERVELEVALGDAASAARRLDVLEVQARASRIHAVVLDRIVERRRRQAEETPPRPNGPANGLVEPLSDRQLLVLRHLTSHLTLPELADELIVSHNTVKTQVSAIYRKLDVRSRSEAVRRARELRLIP